MQKLRALFLGFAFAASAALAAPGQSGPSVHADKIPAGTVASFAGSTAPAGWLLCNGAAVSRTTYAALYAAVGTTYGAGDGSTTFNVPDARGRAIIGAGAGTGLTNRALGATGGAETHTLTESEMPVHSHGVTDPGHVHAIAPYAAGGGGDGATDWRLDQGGSKNSNSATTGISINSAGGGAAHNIMQPWIAFNCIVKY